MSRLLKALRRLRVRWNRYLWIRDLRSGKFRQGQGYLCADRGSKREYCCLGVGIVTLGFTFRAPWSFPSPDDVSPYSDPAGDGSSVLFPAKQGPFRRAFGLREEDIRVLVSMNDRNVPFPAIADRIARFPITLPEEEE